MPSIVCVIDVDVTNGLFEVANASIRYRDWLFVFNGEPDVDGFIGLAVPIEFWIEIFILLVVQLLLLLLPLPNDITFSNDSARRGVE